MRLCLQQQGASTLFVHLFRSQSEKNEQQLKWEVAERARASKRSAGGLPWPDPLKPAPERKDAAAEAAIQDCFSSEDYKEGVQAFLGKRKPVFTGR